MAESVPPEDKNKTDHVECTCHTGTKIVLFDSRFGQWTNRTTCCYVCVCFFFIDKFWCNRSVPTMFVYFRSATGVHYLSRFSIFPVVILDVKKNYRKTANKSGEIVDAYPFCTWAICVFENWRFNTRSLNV